MLVEAVTDQDLILGAYLQDWLSHMRTRVRATTYEGYAALVRHHAVPHLGHIKLAELHPLQIQRLYAALLEPGAGYRGKTLSPKTVGNLHRVLREALGQAVRWRLLDVNPAASVDPPRARRAEITVVDNSDHSTAQVNRALQTTEAGLSFEAPKTPRSRRSVALPGFLLPYLERQRADQVQRREVLEEGWVDQDLIVDRGNGGAWNPDSFSTAWRVFLAKRGLPPVRFHDLRHGHATLMLLQGIHPKIVSERLGHSSIGITLDIYSHVLPTMQAEAARAFDDLFEVSRPIPSES
jgi:Phage integrase, N-terminal SAM-like domain/Phage integrase family